MVIVCPECSASNNSEAIFCSTCGIQLVSPPVPRELNQRYEDLNRNVSDLSRRNETLEERLRRTAEEMRTLTEQLRAEGHAHRTDVEGERSQRRLLDDRLQRTMMEMKTLTAQVRETEQGRRREMLKVAQLAEANNRLLQEVKRFTRKPRYCDRCGGPRWLLRLRMLISAQSVIAIGTPYLNPMHILLRSVVRNGKKQLYLKARETTFTQLLCMRVELGMEYSFMRTAASAAQQLQLTSDPNVLYCQYCGNYQQHTHK